MTMAHHLAVIPARGGSKRIPRKNVRELCGRPMIAYTIAAALESGVFDRVVVSTEDEGIAEIARSLGAEVPFRRGEELADDVTPVSQVTLDALRRLDPEGSRYARVCQLMANCPVRDAADIRASLEQFKASGAGSQLSVTRFAWQNAWWAMRRHETLALEPLFPREIKMRSQDLPPLFCPTGAIWWAQGGVLREFGTFYAPGVTGWEISWQHATDIDTEEDWAMAELLILLERQGQGGQK